MLPAVRRKKKHRADMSCRKVGIVLNTILCTHLTIVTKPCYTEGSICKRFKGGKNK